MPITLRDLLQEAVQNFRTQTAAAEEIGIDRSRFNKVLQGTAEYETFELVNCLRLARALGRSPSEVLKAAGKAAEAELIKELFGAERDLILTSDERDLILKMRGRLTDVREFIDVIQSLSKIVVESVENRERAAQRDLDRQLLESQLTLFRDLRDSAAEKLIELLVAYKGIPSIWMALSIRTQLVSVEEWQAKYEVTREDWQAKYETTRPEMPSDAVNRELNADDGRNERIRRLTERARRIVAAWRVDEFERQLHDRLRGVTEERSKITEQYFDSWPWPPADEMKAALDIYDDPLVGEMLDEHVQQAADHPGFDDTEISQHLTNVDTQAKKNARRALQSPVAPRKETATLKAKRVRLGRWRTEFESALIVLLDPATTSKELERQIRRIVHRAGQIEKQMLGLIEDAQTPEEKTALRHEVELQMGLMFETTKGAYAAWDKAKSRHTAKTTSKVTQSLEKVAASIEEHRTKAGDLDIGSK